MEKPHFFVTCPHCLCYVKIYDDEVNCKLFVHAAFKRDHKSVDPHASRQQCDEWLASGLVFGCANAFGLRLENGTWQTFARDHG